MAVGADEKTEPATPRRREQARAKGQVARSQDLSAAVLLLAGFVLLYWLGPGIWLAMQTAVGLALTADDPADLDALLRYAGSTSVEMLKRLGPYLAVLFVAMLGVLYAQVGGLLTLQPLMPSLNKINPLAGLKRLFSVRVAMTALINLGKLLVVALVAYLTLGANADAIIYAFSLDFRTAFRLGAALVFDLGMRLSVALFVLALLDFAWQRYKHERDLRMTKEEVKDELRSMEGDPKIKQRRRQIQFQLAMQRLRKEGPSADVVVTNPTHVAVAIRYDRQAMPAPKVVAKGADYLALRIRQLAAEFDIPIVQRPPLARALFDAVAVGDYIPERFYQAIAEILAYVYQLAGRVGRLEPTTGRAAS